MDSNPYQSPNTDVDESHQEINEPMTGRMLQELAGTRPWVLFLAILGFIFTGFMILGGILMAVVGIVAPAGGGGAAGLGFGLGMGAVYLVMGALYAVPSYFLYHFAQAIKRLNDTRAASAMEDALARQRSFWRFLGIIVIAVFALYVVFIAIMVGLGVTGALN